MKLEIDFDKLSEKRRNAVLNALFDGANGLRKAYEEVLEEAGKIHNMEIDEKIDSKKAQEKLDKLYNDSKSIIIENNELERLGKEVNTFMYFKTSENWK